MSIELKDCVLITAEQYLELKDPKFEGQTRVAEDNTYYMVWSCDNTFYKTKNKL